MSQLSIKFSLVALLAHSSQVHGAPTCIGKGYLENTDVTLSALTADNKPDPSKPISTYNEKGQDIEGNHRYTTKGEQNKELVCYPDGVEEMFALPGKQHNGIEINFKTPMKTFTLDMRDFGDFNSADMKNGRIIARAMEGNTMVVKEVVAFSPWAAGEAFWADRAKLEKGDACTPAVEGDSTYLGQYRFHLTATGQKTFTKVQLLFKSTTEEGAVDRELIDSNVSWGNLCYEEAPVSEEEQNVVPVATPKIYTPEVAAEEPSTTTKVYTPEASAEVKNEEQPSCGDGGYAYDNALYCKCPAPAVVAQKEVSEVNGTQYQVSVCGDATYELPVGVLPCGGNATEDAVGTGCPMKDDKAVDRCREDIMSYLTGGKNVQNCTAPEHAKCEKLDSGAWGCVFPGNCNSVNKCTQAPTCEGDYQKDAAGECILAPNGYPLATENNTAAINTEDLPKLAESAYFKVGSGASAATVTSLALVATIAVASIFA